MSFQNSSLSLVKKAYNTAWHTFKNFPSIFLPFLIYAVFELVSLAILYLSPRMPLRLIFGPIIKAFWGEGFLHYPTNFLLLPKLASLSRMWLSVLLGSLLTGMAIAIVLDIYNKKQVKLKDSLKSALKKYISLFTIVLLFTAIFYFLVKIITLSLAKYFIAGHSRLLFLRPWIWMGPILLVINFVLAILIQSAFIYAIPVLIIEKEKLVKSIKKSFILFKKLFIPTIILVGLPMLIYIPILVLTYKTPFLINKLFPEFILLVLFLGTIVSSLVIDPVVTVSTTYLYLTNRESS